MQGTDSRTTIVDCGLQRGLRRLRASIRFRLILRGIGWTCAAVCAAAWISFVLDYGLYRITARHLGLISRLIVDAACLGGVLAILWKRLLRSVFREFPDDDLAVLVERGHPQLQDRLISSLQFSRVSPAETGESPELVEKVLEETNAATRSVSFLAVLRMNPVWSALLAALGLSVFTGGAAMLGWRVAGPWAERNLLLRDAKYPRQTILRIEGGRLQRVVRGDPLKIVVAVEPGTVAPREVEFHMKFTSIGAATEIVGLLPGSNPIYVKVFPVVTEPFKFFVTGNDDQTGEVKVETVEPPELTELELEVRSPQYTGLAPRKVRRGAGMIDVPEGGVVVLSGLATKDLAAVRILLDGVPIKNSRIVSDSGQPRRIGGELTVDAPKPFRPSRSLRIELRDTGGFTNAKAAAYSLVLRQDQPPVCQLEAVGIGGEVTINAVIPMIITAKDDYGVAGINMEWSVQSAAQNTAQYGLKAYATPEPEPEALHCAFDLPLSSENASTNIPPLQVGETLRLQAIAIDSMPATNNGPHKVPSNLLSFRIVTAEDLMAKAMDAKRSVREQIRQAIENQTDVLERSRAATKDAAQSTTIGIAQREIKSCLDAEIQICDQVSNCVTRLDAVLEQLRNNRVVAGSDDMWLRANVVGPLRKLLAAIPPIAQGFLAARPVTDPKVLVPKINDLIQAQEQLIRAMEAIVAEMRKFEDAVEIERTTRGLIRKLDEIRAIMRPDKAGKKSENPPALEKKQ